MKVSGIVCCYNEENNVESLVENLKDLDEIIIIDHLSSDKTKKLCKKLGVKVITQGNYILNVVTQEDIEEFIKMFGYSPVFKVGNTIPHSGIDRNKCAEYCKNDWVYFPDADERVTWDIKKIQILMDEYDMITCDFVHTHLPNGDKGVVFDTSKLYRQSKCWWEGRIHEFVTGYNTKNVKSESMKIDHYQTPREYRRTFLPILEYAVLKDRDSRSANYLGREYFAYGEYQKAINMLIISLRTAFNIVEIQSSYIYLAKSHWALDNVKAAEFYCFEAIKVDPTNKDAFLTMSEFCKPEHIKTWKDISSLIKQMV